MKKVGILGGTFNPPHNGHLFIANEVLHNLELNEIWFMPNQTPPHKQKDDTVADSDRLEMLKLAVQGNDQFRIETMELERSGVSYTVDTMEILQKRNPDVEFYFIIGADMIEYLPKWHRIDDLLKLVKFVGVNRPGYATASSYPIFELRIPFLEISSSEIRQRVKKGQPIHFLLPDRVISYLKERQLYDS